MDVIFLQGGLGNQMFQYAFYLVKKKGGKVSYDCGLLSIDRQHNGFELEKLFGVYYRTNKMRVLLLRIMLFLHRKNNYLYRFLSLFMSSCFKCRLIEDTMPSSFDSHLLLSQNAYYYGYWQTEKYFIHIRPLLLNVFRFDESKLSEQTLAMANRMQCSDSVSLHVRRGDYLSEQNKAVYGDICTLAYYERAIAMIQERIPNAEFYVFSDDMDWVKQNLSISNATFVNWNRQEDSWQDMYLMSQCKHNITANSTFSWWGAWLNIHSEKIVVCPSRFINSSMPSDIIPDSWMKL